jgi:AcrR family transcriptional regulator
MNEQALSKGENTRQKVLQAAYQLFLEKGYHATSIRDISQRSKLTIGGVYNHFSGKGEIFEAVLSENHPFQQVNEAIELAEGDTVEALVHDMARRMVDTLGAHRAALNLLFIEIVEFQGRHFTDSFPVVFPRLLAVIERISNQGDILRPLSKTVLVRSFFGLFFSYFMTNIILADRMPSDDKTLDAFVDIYLYGILTTSSSPHS